MPRGSKEKHTTKQKRQVSHIQESAMKAGRSLRKAAQIAWATVNKEAGGAGQTVRSTEPSRKGAKKTARNRKQNESHPRT